jgi:N-acetylmuramoyl-L-alanine amidase
MLGSAHQLTVREGTIVRFARRDAAVTQPVPCGKTPWGANIGVGQRGVNEAATVHYLARMTCSPTRNGRSLVLGIAALAVGCASAARPAAPAPAPRLPTPPLSAPAPTLPPVPLIDGPLAPRVTFPPADYAIPSRDSNFIFGTIGNGRATLSINGRPAQVWPNGTYLAFVPNPPPDAPRYELVATLGRDTARLTHPVRIAPAREPLPTAGPLMVDTASATPQGTLLLHDDERVRVSLRAPANAGAFVAWPAGRQPLTWLGGETFVTELPARAFRDSAVVVVTRDADTVRLPLARLDPVDSTPPRWVQLGDSVAMADTDRVVIGRPIPAGTYKWMLLPGTIVQQTGRSGGNVRVRLDASLEVWVDSVDVRPLPSETLGPRRTVGPITLVPAAEWVDAVLPVASRPPFLIEQRDAQITLTLYGTQATPDVIRFLENDSLVRFINWVPETSDRARLTFEMSVNPYGYLVLWDTTRGGMVLRLRRPPAVDASRPLRGLTLVVDPGHPPGGAIGPTGLTEAEAVLQIGERLRRMLVQRGANVVMTRTTMDPVDLRLRSVIARRVNAHALLSVHLNAFGDGVNPFVNNGTSTLFFHPQTEPLARAIQRALVRQLGLRDLGVHYQNIAIGRTTWMPALITEGLFMMLGDQEHAVRVADGQERYARAIVEGTEVYFRSLARGK